MCGICGIRSFSALRDPATDMRPMLSALAHRGTVDGTWTGNGVALGSRRLPIIDVAHSAQPIFNEDRSLVLVGNGEIYNFVDLRPDLLKKGHVFSTEGDLECILHLYEDMGDDLWKRLNGMFAIALYDLRRDELTLARDRSGIKPLFYCRTPAFLAFSSEIRSLRCHPGFHAELNPQAVADYLSLQFVPRPQTIYRDAFSLPPSGLLKNKGTRMEISRFWERKPGSSRGPMNRADAAAETKRLLTAAVKRQLVSDVPLGVLLSGGLDSSGVAALAARASSSPIKTFAIAFREKTFDESAFSRNVAEFLGTDHHELVLDEETILNSMPGIARFFEEPFCEGSAIPLYHICGYAKPKVDVLLAGEGSDEIFGGYETYAARNMIRYYHLLPRFVRSGLRRMAHRLPVSDNKVSLDLKLRRLTDGADLPPPKSHFWWRCALNDREKERLLQPDFARKLDSLPTSAVYEKAFEAMGGDDVLNRLMATDCAIHLPDDLLYRADLMSMAHTLELRVPYLDTELVEFALATPSRLKIRGTTGKIPLRDALKGLIPDPIRRRAKKGLNMPYQKWFKNPRWKSFLHETLTRDHIEAGGILNSRAVHGMLDDHEKGRHNHAHGLWAIMNLVLWMDASHHGS